MVPDETIGNMKRAIDNITKNQNIDSYILDAFYWNATLRVIKSVYLLCYLGEPDCAIEIITMHEPVSTANNMSYNSLKCLVYKQGYNIDDMRTSEVNAVYMNYKNKLSASINKNIERIVKEKPK
jgi:hypothetical protein